MSVEPLTPAELQALAFQRLGRAYYRAVEQNGEAHAMYVLVNRLTFECDGLSEAHPKLKTMIEGWRR